MVRSKSRAARSLANACLMSASATSVAVGCGPLPVEEAVAGGAAGKGSEVGGVALEGAAALAGGAVAESGGALSGVATTGGDASDAMAKAAETLVRTRAWRTLAGPHRKTRDPNVSPRTPPPAVRPRSCS